jgi:hypothetical protein
MADERDPKVSQRYRDLGGDEPPPALDDAILAASRRSVVSRRRWYLPLAAAAAIVLAVGVAVQVEHGQPEQQAPTSPSDVREEEARQFRKEAFKDRREAAPARVPQTAPARATGSLLGRAAEADPEQWLLSIAELRKAGRDEEADKALAEFRQRYPDYRIPEEMRAKVERPN